MEANYLQWISAIGAIVTPLVLAIVGAILTRVATRQEKVFELQAKLQDDRIAIYNKILEPYIIATIPPEIFAKDKKYHGKNSGEIATELILNPEYKQAEFKLLMIGSDGVVTSYKKLKKYFYKHTGTLAPDQVKTLLTLESQIILEIRKSVGNEDTQISHNDTVWWFVKDADTYFPEA
jgi:hypothetical protein